MALTLQQIYDRYSEVEFVRNISIRRRIEAETYEPTYTNVEDLTLRKVNTYEVVKDISFQAPNDTTNFGFITAANCNFLFENIYGEMSGEDTPTSIFVGFIRHRSLIKVEDGYIDPETGLAVLTTSFEGMIDDTLCITTFDNQERIVAIDILTAKMKQYQIGDFATFTSTDLNDLIYEIFNRTEFTEFFTVDTLNIDAGFNIDTFDISQYGNNTQILTLIQNLSLGHSIVYVKNGVLFYSAITATPLVDVNFLETPERKISFSAYNSGGQRVFDTIYWFGTNLNFSAPDKIYNNQITIDILGVTDTLERLDILSYLGAIYSEKRPHFVLSIPYLPTIFVLDRIAIQRQGSIQEGSFVVDVSLLGEDSFLYPAIGAITISGSENWIVKGVKHSSKLTTTLTVEKIVV